MLDHSSANPFLLIGIRFARDREQHHGAKQCGEQSPFHSHFLSLVHPRNLDWTKLIVAYSQSEREMTRNLRNSKSNCAIMLEETTIAALSSTAGNLQKYA